MHTHPGSVGVLSSIDESYSAVLWNLPSKQLRSPVQMFLLRVSSTQMFPLMQKFFVMQPEPHSLLVPISSPQVLHAATVYSRTSGIVSVISVEFSVKAQT